MRRAASCGLGSNRTFSATQRRVEIQTAARRRAHHHLRLVDAINPHPAYLGASIVAQGVDPFLAMLGVFP